MSLEKIKSHVYFDKEDQVKRYVSVYGTPDFSKKYPQNKQRLSIILSLLDNIKPHNVVDAGCGAGIPLVHLLNSGFNASGYDKSQNMVKAAKKNLIQNKHNPNRVSIANFENPSHLENSSIDCITGMGAFYYADNFLKTLKNQNSKLKTGGHLIFSLRNKLFDLATLNNFTKEFLSELYAIDKFDEEVKKLFFEKFPNNETENKKFSTVDDSGVLSQFHNPLTIEEEVLKPLGLDLQGIYFYHFHALPPLFEHIMPEEFRRRSWEMEDPLDWKGHFLSSCFIIHCIKR